MTMQLEITNKDTNRTLVVVQRDKGSSKDQPGTEVGPGKSATFHVWAQNELVLLEKQDEAK